MDIDVARAIEEVLDQRKAVNIQGLGSLILEDTPASFSDDALQMLPPSTELRFYETKTKNGPLRKHLMYRNDLSKEAAQNVIKKFSQTVVNALLNYNEVNIKGVTKIKKTDSGYTLKPKKSFINKYYGGLPIIDLPEKDKKVSEEKKAIVKPLTASNVMAASGAATSKNKSLTDNSKTTLSSTKPSFADKVAASNKMSISPTKKTLNVDASQKRLADTKLEAEKGSTPKTTTQTASIPPTKPITATTTSKSSTPTPDPIAIKTSRSATPIVPAKGIPVVPAKSTAAPQQNPVTPKANVTTPAAKIPPTPQVAPPSVPSTDPIIKTTTQPTKTTTQPPTKAHTPATKATKPSFQTPKPIPATKPTPSPTGSTAASSTSKKPTVLESAKKKSISSANKPPTLTLNDRLAQQADDASKKASSAIKSTTTATTSSIKDKYNILTPVTQTTEEIKKKYNLSTQSSNTPPPVYQDEGMGCRGPIIGLLALVILSSLIYYGCRKFSGKDSGDTKLSASELADVEGNTSDTSTELLDDETTATDASTDDVDTASAESDKPSSCIIITGVFSKAYNVTKMENILETRGYTVYMEDYGPNTRVGLEYDCSNEDLVDYIQNIRRTIPHAARAWYLEPEMHVDY